MLVLEEFEAAQARGAHIYCEVAGYASRGNAYHMTGLRPDGARDGRGDHRRDGAGRHRARGHRLHQRARLGDQAERPPRDRGVQALARRPRLQDPDQLDQVDGRPLARRRSARSRWPPARWPSTAASSRRPRTGRTPTPSATSTTRPNEARAGQVDAALSTGSGFGGFQSAMILARPKELQEVGVLMAPESPSSRSTCRTAGPRRGASPGSAWSRRTASATTPGGRRPRRARAASGRITRFDPSQYPTQLAGEVDGFDADDYLEQRLIVQTDHWTHMALAATQMALDDASYDPEGTDPYRMSVITASGSGGNEFGQREIQNLWGKGPTSSAPTSRSPGSTRRRRARSRSSTG